MQEGSDFWSLWPKKFLDILIINMNTDTRGIDWVLKNIETLNGQHAKEAKVIIIKRMLGPFACGFIASWLLLSKKLSEKTVKMSWLPKNCFKLGVPLVIAGIVSTCYQETANIELLELRDRITKESISE